MAAIGLALVLLGIALAFTEHIVWAFAAIISGAGLSFMSLIILAWRYLP